jgi:DNA gyrase subunit A
VVTLMEVLPEDEIMIITKSGMIIRSPVSQVRVAGRNTQGVKLVNLDAGDMVMAVARVVPDDDKDTGEGENGDNGAGPDQAELALGDETEA